MNIRLLAASCLALLPAVGACALDEAELEISEESSELTNSPAISGQPAVVMLDLPSGGRCSGMILTRHWILTAAHCANNQTQGGTVTVRRGMDETSPPIYAGPGHFTMHPDYDAWLEGTGGWDFDDDVGLVRLTGSGLSAITEQMSLYTGSISEGDEIIVVGYGIGSDEGSSQWCGDAGPSGTKREQTFTLEEVTGELLRFPWGTSRTCPGDSGAPHIIPHADHKFAGAVHSGERDFAYNDSAGSRISAKRSWIEQVLATSTTPAKCGHFVQTGETGISFFGCYESSQGVRPPWISAGRTHACAVLYDGRARCWGDNASGQLGDGTLDDRDMPVTAFWSAGGTSLLRISAGWYHTCASTNTNEATCWGSHTSGQLGNPSLASGLYTEGQRVQFADGTPLTNVTRIASGGMHSCALTSAGRVYCWGANSRGQLGNDSTTASTQPTLVGQYEVLENDPGFRTASTTAISIPLPRRFIPLENVIELEAGYRHTCAIKSDYTAWCWGDNTFGQLGNGTTTLSAKPVKVATLTNVFRISAGYGHTCATYGSAGDRAACWGYNAFGQLGTGNTTNATTPRVITPSLGVALEVSAGYLQTCFVGSTKQQKCAGYNASGELGNNSTANSSTLVLTLMEADARVPAAGNEFTCTLKHAGTVACTGRNADGQLGANNTQNLRWPYNVMHLHHLPNAQ